MTRLGTLSGSTTSGLGEAVFGGYAEKCYNQEYTSTCGHRGSRFKVVNTEEKEMIDHENNAYSTLINTLVCEMGVEGTFL